MSTTTGLLRPFGHVEDNPVLLDKNVTTPVCEGFNAVLSSFQGLYLQYQKHHFVVEGSEFYALHEFFAESYGEVQGHVHEIGERQNGLGGIPAASFSKLAELCCFAQEADGVFGERQMVEHDLAAEQEIIKLLRQQAAQAACRHAQDDEANEQARRERIHAQPRGHDAAARLPALK